MDIYSFGVILYELMTGCVPYSLVQGGLEGFRQHVFEHHYRPDLDYDDCGRPIRVPLEIQNIIKRCWHEDSRLRPSAKEIFHFFDNYQYNNYDDECCVIS